MVTHYYNTVRYWYLFIYLKEYVGKAIEITYLALDELKEKEPSKKRMADFWNTLSDEAAEKLYENVNKMRGELEIDTNWQQCKIDFWNGSFRFIIAATS